ncbi:hypothetical protein [Paenibacillus ihumii]|uniref:hypothetical protein n=1 Tax=Paenibacillus ihumii TaxID=687436 RepID=UPI0006D7FF6C|nr:hypothetical protein [Paenibacillus ihumii]
MGYKYAVVKTPMVYRNLYVPNGGVTIDIGTIIGYDEESREIFMPRDYAGKFVYLPSIEEIPENEFTNLWRNSQLIAQQRDKAINDLAKHAQTLVDIQNELNAMREKVMLPRDVAEAIESFRDEGHDNDYIMRYLARDLSNGGTPSNRLVTLKNYSRENGGQLIQALANGYTVEQSPEERLHAEVKELLGDWRGSTIDEKLIDRMAGRIVEHAKQFT